LRSTPVTGTPTTRLLEAIIAGDGDAAEKAAAEHVTRFEAEIRKAL
jgi:DNA-binding GntR family transcriptional regulator